MIALPTMAIAMFAAAVIHVAEEACTGWIAWANRFISGVSKLQFWAINALFLIFCAIAIFWRNEFLVLTIASVLFINAWIHIVPTITQRRRSPGVFSAVLLYLPLSALILRAGIRNGSIIRPLLCGLALMAVPFIFQLARLATRKSGSSSLPM